MALVLVGLSSAAIAQYCPLNTTYFYNTSHSCSLGSCWAATNVGGLTAGSTGDPNAYYACAAATPPSGYPENTFRLYDERGNLAAVQEPGKSAEALYSYDALNRLKTMSDPVAADTIQTKYTYDATGNLTKVEAPLGKVEVLPSTNPPTYAYQWAVTDYTFNALGNRIGESSVDTGVITYPSNVATGGTRYTSFNGAGNVLTRVDARDVTATYQYDNLQRVKQVAYTKSTLTTLTHYFDYDVGTNGKGHLTHITEKNGVSPSQTVISDTSWTYTPQGRVSTKSQSVGGGTALGVTYAYSSTTGQLTDLTLPSGYTLHYTYTNNRVSAITLKQGTTTIDTLLSSVTTTPFGPISGWTWGNSATMTRHYDLNGRMDYWEYKAGTTSLLKKQLSYDAAGRVKDITDPATSSLNQYYTTYDDLDRLVKVRTATNTTSSPHQQFSYDWNGNRLSKQTYDGTNTVTKNYQYTSLSNRLTDDGTHTYVHNAVGHINSTDSATYTYVYDPAERLNKVQQGGTDIAVYDVNALGQRVRKTVGSTVIQFVYDEAGHLIGEYDGSGNMIQETVWLEDLPVVMLRYIAGSSPPQINWLYVHADHLGTPRALSRRTDDAFRWKWESTDPFGANAENPSPAGLPNQSYNLRFPGQYYDAETGLHYNYFRDYDPAIGRYRESDPIGLSGGTNRYGYVASAPAVKADPYGLWAVPFPVVPFVAPPVPGELTIPGFAPSPSASPRLPQFQMPSAAELCAISPAACTAVVLGKAIYDMCRPGPDCEQLLKDDTDTCNAITKRRGRIKGAACHESASARWAACLRGDPLPPLNTWNN